MKNNDEELEEEWVVCLSHECPDNAPFKDYPSKLSEHLHKKSDCEKNGWEYKKDETR